MAIRLVGEILSPSSCPMADVTITLEAVATSASVLLSSSASVKTDYKGRYDFVVPTGLYSVSLSHDAVSSPEDIGQIQVFSDSTESTLQALLDAPEEEPSPTWWIQIEEALAQSKIHADAAAKSAADALASSEGVEAFSDAAKQHADRAANSASNSAKSATSSEESAVRAEEILELAESAAEKLPEIIAEGDRQVARVKAEGNKFIAQTTMIVTDATEQAERAKVEADRAKSEADRAAEIVGLDNVDAAVADALGRAHMYAMTKAEFDALRAKRKSDNAGSGFLNWGKHHSNQSATWHVNVGLWGYVDEVNSAHIGIDHATSSVGASRTNLAQAVIDGCAITLAGTKKDKSLGCVITLPPSPSGVKTYDSASGVVVDYSKDVDPRYGDVAADHNEAVARAFEGLVKNGDFRLGLDGWVNGSPSVITEGGLDVIAPVGGSGNWAITQTQKAKTTGLYEIEIVSKLIEPLSFVCRVGGDVGYDNAVIEAGERVTKFTRNILATTDLSQFYFQSGNREGKKYGVIKSVSIRPVTEQVIVSRQDLVFLESWHETVDEKGVLLVYGSCQFGEAGAWNGVPLKKLTDLGVAQGYSAFGEWDKSTVGYGAKISDLTDEQLQKFISEPSNNIYYDSSSKKLIQARYRIRCIEGCGDEWGNVSTQTGNWVGYSTNSRVNFQGSSVDVPNMSGFGELNIRPIGTVDLYANKTQGQWGGQEGHFAIPICLVQRLNQGAYHPVFSPFGCASGHHANVNFPKWYEPFMQQRIKSTADCFKPNLWWDGYDPTTYNAGSISAGTAKSGRPDSMKFYDAVYSSQVIDLRLSARKQDVNLLRENAIRQAVRGEMRGRGKVPFTTKIAAIHHDNTSIKSYIQSFSCGFETFSDNFVKECTGSTVSKRVAVSSIVYNLTKNAFATEMWTDSRDNTVWFYSTSNVEVGDELFISVYLGDSPEFDTVPWVDVIGTPENIAATFPDGVAGMWIPQIPDGTAINFNLNRKSIASNVNWQMTNDNGATWLNATQEVGSVANTWRGSPAQNAVMLLHYETPSSFTVAADNSVVVGSVGDVDFSMEPHISRANRLAQSTVGKVMKNSAEVVNGGVTKTLVYSINQSQMFDSFARYKPLPTHMALPLGAPTNDSHAVKALSTITEKDGLLYLQLHANELIHNGTNWGDDSTVKIGDGEGTFEDKNGTVCKRVCHHSMLPLGIADSSSSAISMKGLDKSGVNDGLNLGLHFTTLDDVPEKIREFYFQEDFILEEKFKEEVKVDEETGEEYVVQVPDHVMGIRVIKYPHPHENGGHISPESIAAWEYHDQYKDWLTACLEIQFQNSLPPELDENGDEIPHVELPFPTEPVRVKPE